MRRAWPSTSSPTARPPRRRHRPQQPGGLLQATEPPGRGRAADAPGPGHRRAVVRPGPPRRRHRPQQPGGVAAGHEPPGRGRAAVAPGAGHRRAVVRPGPPRRRHRPQQPGGVAAGHQPPGEAEPLARRRSADSHRVPAPDRARTPEFPRRPGQLSGPLARRWGGHPSRSSSSWTNWSAPGIPKAPDTEHRPGHASENRSDCIGPPSPRPRQFGRRRTDPIRVTPVVPLVRTRRA